MRSKVYRYGRAMRTTQELRANQDCPYTRAKRKKNYLPNAYWDDYIRTTNNWKDKRLKQYRPDGRGEKHRVVLPSSKWQSFSALEEYFKSHNIPYHLSEGKYWWNNQDITITWWSDKDIGIDYILARYEL